MIQANTFTGCYGEFIIRVQDTYGMQITGNQISQAFVLMLAERREKDLDGWLVQAEQSGIAELKKFAQGIRLDYAAVRAAFTSPWSQGQVEAQVNCLKLQKRIVFGRANFDLLRLPVLCRV